MDWLYFFMMIFLSLGLTYGKVYLEQLFAFKQDSVVKLQSDMVGRLFAYESILIAMKHFRLTVLIYHVMNWSTYICWNFVILFYSTHQWLSGCFLVLALGLSLWSFVRYQICIVPLFAILHCFHIVKPDYLYQSHRRMVEYNKLPWQQ